MTGALKEMTAVQLNSHSLFICFKVELSSYQRLCYSLCKEGLKTKYFLYVQFDSLLC